MCEVTQKTDSGLAFGLLLQPPSIQPAALRTHHKERPFRLAEADDHDQGDTHHGGQGQAPAQPDGPGGVHVHFVVGQGYVLDEREDETSLWRDGAVRTVLALGVGCFWDQGRPHP